jgi:hypothetical protein
MTDVLGEGGLCCRAVIRAERMAASLGAGSDDDAVDSAMPAEPELSHFKTSASEILISFPNRKARMSPRAIMARTLPSDTFHRLARSIVRYTVMLASC